MPEEVDWFPERAWGGRVWVPCSARTEGDEGTLELFGHVSYVQPEGDGDPSDFRAKADFTDVLAEDNPDWKIDLNDDVIGRWRGENGRAGAVTLVWGRPLVRGAVAATAELDGETVDQEAISNDRFTLIALDALEGYGDDIFMEVKLWSRRARAGLREPLRRGRDRRAGPRARGLGTPGPVPDRRDQGRGPEPTPRPDRKFRRRLLFAAGQDLDQDRGVDHLHRSPRASRM